MAKVTITFTDLKNGKLDITADFKPAINSKMNTDDLTNAQAYALQSFEYIKNLATESEDE